MLCALSDVYLRLIRRSDSYPRRKKLLPAVGGPPISDDAQNVLNLGNYGYESMILQPLLLILLKEGSDDFERYRPNFHS